MATITTSVTDPSGFLPQIWANRALDVLRAQLPIVNTVARDTSWGENDFAFKGKSLTIGYPGTMTVQDKSEGSPVVPSAPSGSSVTLTLDHHKIVSFLVEDFSAVQSQFNLMDQYLRASTIALAEQFESDLVGLISSLSLGPIGTGGTAVDAALVRQLKATLDNAKAPLTDRHLVLSPDQITAILGDSDLAPYFAYSRPEAVAQGSVGNLYGITIWLSQMIQPVSGTTTNAGYHRDALLYATRPFSPPPAGSGVMTATAIDSTSGLSLRTSAQYSIAAVGVQVNLDILYGMTVLRADQGTPVLS